MDRGTEMLAPRARSAGIVVRELTDETLVYDVVAEQAHALDRMTALVWSYCDGETPVARMVGKLELALGEPVADDKVWQVIAQLADKNLLDEEAETKPNAMSRRDMLVKAGVAATAVVAISSIRVPITAASVTCQSGGPCGGYCPYGQPGANGFCNGANYNQCDLLPVGNTNSCGGMCCVNNSNSNTGTQGKTFNSQYCTVDGNASSPTNPDCCCHGTSCTETSTGSGVWTCR